jgi:hypothetical protein
MAERVCLRILLRQELFRLGILYLNDGERQDCEPHAKDNAILCDVPLRQEAPMFVIRPSRRSRRRRSTLCSLPLYLSLSNLSDDTDIAYFMSPILHNTPTIQHRDLILSTTASIIDIDVPQSLPPTTPALSSSLQLRESAILLRHNAPTFVQAGEDWTFITHTHNTHDSTPCSEPETWSLCDDS